MLVHFPLSSLRIHVLCMYHMMCSTGMPTNQTDAGADLDGSLATVLDISLSM